jgi:alpha-L-rhamnosidase
VIGDVASAGLVVASLRSQLAENVLASGAGPVRLTWTLRSSDDPTARQLAYEIEALADDRSGRRWGSNEVLGDAQVAVAAPDGPLGSRETRVYRVRVRSTAGWSAWSDTVRVEAGLLDGADWVGDAITLPDDPGDATPSPSPLLRRSFIVDRPVRRARLYVTSFGLHRITIDGSSVTDDLLAPGWTPYGKRILAESYEVTELLGIGEHVIGAVLGDGWYRGRLGWEGETARNTYGAQLALLAQLELTFDDGTTSIVATDGSWQASTGAIRRADLYDGCHVDLRQAQADWDRPGFDSAAWRSVVVVPLDTSLIEPRVAPPVRVIATLPCAITPLPGARGWRLDAGQNATGWVRMRVRGSTDATVTVRHAEVLEPDGSLHTRSLRSAKATDTYVLAGGDPVVLEPSFTFHGFRYAEIEGDIELLDASVVAISSVDEPRSRFACSDPMLERLHANVVWSLRDNFVSVPTDCPQRDERLGWTGDAQAFAATASLLVDCQAFWSSWLRDLELEQDPVLGVSTVVPDVVVSGEPRFGRAGWSDAATIVPAAVYEAYGDPEVLRAQLPSMRAHVDSLDARRGSDGLLPEAFQFGDWLDPDAPSDRPWLAKADGRYIANAFLVHSARLTATAARVLGRPDVAEPYERLATEVAAATWTTWAAHAVTNQTGCAIALELGIAPEAERARVGEALAALVHEADGRVATGFLGTPLVLPALSAAGRFDAAYLMLLRQQVPSWLYQVVTGATTVWERWDAIRPDGTIHDGRMLPFPEGSEADEGHMLSFNHYAYGAVVDWIYRHVAGIAPSTPGYRSIRIAPRPVAGLDHAEARVATPYGNATISWVVLPEGFRVRLTIPVGTSATLDLPAGPDSIVSLDGRPLAATVLDAGAHDLLVTNPRIVVRGKSAEITDTAQPARAGAGGATEAW